MASYQAFLISTSAPYWPFRRLVDLVNGANRRSASVISRASENAADCRLHVHEPQLQALSVRAREWRQCGP